MCNSKQFTVMDRLEDNGHKHVKGPALLLRRAKTPKRKICKTVLCLSIVVLHLFVVIFHLFAVILYLFVVMLSVFVVILHLFCLTDFTTSQSIHTDNLCEVTYSRRSGPGAQGPVSGRPVIHHHPY